MCCRIQKCLFCDLKAGSYTSAIFTFVSGVVGIAFFSLIILHLKAIQDTHDHENVDKIIDPFIKAFLAIDFIFIVWLLSSICLLVGLSKRVRWTLHFWIIMTIIIIVITVFGIAFSIIIGQGIGLEGGTAWLDITVKVATSILNIYGMICVNSYFQTSTDTQGQVVAIQMYPVQMQGDTFGQPQAQYGQPQVQYGPPAPPYGQPVPQYGEPTVNYGQPPPAYSPQPPPIGFK